MLKKCGRPSCEVYPGMRCARCKLRYCSRECQREHLEDHRPVCNQRVDEAAAAAAEAAVQNAAEEAAELAAEAARARAAAVAAAEILARTSDRPALTKRGWLAELSRSRAPTRPRRGRPLPPAARDRPQAAGARRWLCVLAVAGLCGLVAQGLYGLSAAAPGMDVAAEGGLYRQEAAAQSKPLRSTHGGAATSEARTRFEQAAMQGDPDAQFSYALCFARGSHGAVQSWPNAVHYFRKAAEQGRADANFNLGICYAQGMVCCGGLECTLTYAMFMRCLCAGHSAPERCLKESPSRQYTTPNEIFRSSCVSWQHTWDKWASVQAGSAPCALCTM
jgi:hypothetical protein